MTRVSTVIVLVAVAAIPALGADPVSLSTNEIHALTPIDSIPTKADITNVAGPDPVGRLRDLALDGNTDFGVRVRAIRALPQFCNSVPSCKDQGDSPIHEARQAVRDVIATIVFDDVSGRTILQLRAAIEALGVIKSAQQSDVDVLLPYLDHTSRDIRITTARALRDLCLDTAIQPLRTRYDQEPVLSVRLAISGALGDLDVCSP
jgi:hypothetical protein